MRFPREHCIYYIVNTVLLLISECILLKVVQDYNTHIENKYSTVLIFYSEIEFIYILKISEIDLRA